MNNEPICRFLSERSIILHKEYLQNEKLKYSILEKSFPEIVGKGYSAIYSKRSLPKDARREILILLADIKMHELYFSSFSQNPEPCDKIREHYASEDTFLYEAWLLGREKRTGFLYFWCDRRGGPHFDYEREAADVFLKAEPKLAVDLCEHAYFLDYGFESGEYLRRALGLIDISRLADKS